MSLVKKIMEMRCEFTSDTGGLPTEVKIPRSWQSDLYGELYELRQKIQDESLKPTSLTDLFDMQVLFYEDGDDVVLK